MSALPGFLVGLTLGLIVVWRRRPKPTDSTAFREATGRDVLDDVDGDELASTAESGHQFVHHGDPRWGSAA